MSIIKSFRIDSIDVKRGILIVKNDVFNKVYEVPVTQEELEFYTEAFDEALSKDMFLSIEYDEARGVIVDG